jgi:hypothetical protein
MTITRLKYGKSFQIGLSIWERIDVEADIAPDESANSCFDELKKEVDFTHRLLNPNLYPTGKEAIISSYGELPEVQINKPKSTTEAIIEQINQCTDKTVLSSFEKLAKTYPEIMDAYNKKFDELP